MSQKKILVIGSGGREHAICWKLSQSSKVDTIYCLPGGHGIGEVDNVKILNDVNPKDFQTIASWCKQNSIDLVVVGPEDPLANGLGDELRRANVKCFGPDKRGAQIEADKSWAKKFMLKYEIPTARYESFTDPIKAKNFIKSAPYKALVVKASGLAAGKGVIVASNTDEACEAVDEILGTKKFGSAGEVVIIEELLSGEEVSVLAFVDNNTVQLMLPSQDHKRLRNHDMGPNTGGMGAYCPCPLIGESDLDFVRVNVLEKAINGLLKEDIKYCGILYAGLMLTSDGPRVLEFNCRFGDPETQVILPLLNSDLYDIMNACCENTLRNITINWKNNLSAVGVVMASAGYPETSTKGCIIEGIPQNTDSLQVFHSGIALNSTGKYITNGGRVLIVVKLDENLRLSAAEATRICENIKFSGAGAQFRTDIAQKAFKFLSLSYKDSGVDIDAGDNLVQRIKSLARGTRRPGAVGGIGGFGGLFDLNELSYKNPILCEVTNGVGSKMKFALEYEMYESIGYDLVAMCVNEVLESGAEPISFLDYIACGRLHVPIAAQIVKGISEACRKANCALLGGETAEMPSVYAVGKYDLAGYCLGVIEEGNVLPKFDDYVEGDLIVALPSNGFHCSDLSGLQIDKNASSPFDPNKTLVQEIFQSTRIYVKNILPLLQRNYLKAVAHVDNGLRIALRKILPAKYIANMNAENFTIPEIYGWLKKSVTISNDELLDKFNCGMGLLFVVSRNNSEWRNLVPEGQVIGVIRKQKSSSGTEQIVINNFDVAVKKVVEKFNQREYKIKNAIDANAFNASTASEHLQNTIDLMLEKTKKTQTVLSRTKKRLTKISKSNYRDPILVIGTDGVGTKIKIAQQYNLHSTVGIDLVAMCVNDILCNGAEPLTFLSYYAGGNIDENTTKDIVSGVVEGSLQGECTLIESKVFEVPQLYEKNVYDLAGFSLGITERNHMLPLMESLKGGDVIIGLPSSGIHSNGFSLVHKIMEYSREKFTNKIPYGDKTFAEEFLTPTKIYVSAIKPLLEKGLIKALAHITGGGLLENIPRVLRKELAVHLNAANWNILPIFAWLAAKGNVDEYEMLRTFNCGIGMILVANPIHEYEIMQHLRFAHKATKIGNVIQRKSTNTPQVIVENFDNCLAHVQRNIKMPKKRTAVLISGSGTNLQALINATRDSTMGMCAEIVLVISNKPNVMGLERAKNANISSVVISHKDYPTREEFDEEMTRHLEASKVDIICLAGFMRILSENFVKRWKGKLMNIHPSLLPKYPGLNVQQKAIDAGDSESGCTVHFVDEGLDSGGIIVQEKVPILAKDTVETLTERIHSAEHYAFPCALRLVATELVSLDVTTGKVKFSF